VCIIFAVYRQDDLRNLFSECGSVVRVAITAPDRFTNPELSRYTYGWVSAACDSITQLLWHKVDNYGLKIGKHCHTVESYLTTIVALLHQLSNWVVLCFCYSISAVFWHWSMLVSCQEKHLALKSWVMRCWHGYLSWARCRFLAYGPTNATFSPNRHNLSLQFTTVLLFGTSLSRLS